MEKIYCPNCKKITNHNSVQKKENKSDSSAEFHWKETFEIIECAGCENVQFKHTYGDEDMANYSNDGESIDYYDEVKLYPQYIEGYERLRFIFNLPLKIRKIYLETIEAFKAKCYILTGVGFRTVIEAICSDKNIEGYDLQTKINNLYVEKLITKKESQRLHSIRFLGNDSAHERLSPEPETLRIVLEIVDHLLSNLYLLDIEADERLEQVVSKYEVFEELIRHKTIGLEDGEEFTIKNLLGKSIRRIDQDDMITFIQELLRKIDEREVEWLEVNAREPANERLLKFQKFIKSAETVYNRLNSY